LHGARNRKFESIPLQRRVCEPSVPVGRVVHLLASIVTFWRPSAIDRLRSPVLLFDAAGLVLFAVAGAQKALAFGLNPVMAALLAMLTGIGGGMTRDLLLAQIPTVVQDAPPRRLSRCSTCRARDGYRSPSVTSPASWGPGYPVKRRPAG